MGKSLNNYIFRHYIPKSIFINFVSDYNGCDDIIHLSSKNYGQVSASITWLTIVIYKYLCNPDFYNYMMDTYFNRCMLLNLDEKDVEIKVSLETPELFEETGIHKIDCKIKLKSDYADGTLSFSNVILYVSIRFMTYLSIMWSLGADYALTLIKDLYVSDLKFSFTVPAKIIIDKDDYIDDYILCNDRCDYKISLCNKNVYIPKLEIDGMTIHDYNNLASMNVKLNYYYIVIEDDFNSIEFINFLLEPNKFVEKKILYCNSKNYFYKNTLKKLKVVKEDIKKNIVFCYDKKRQDEVSGLVETCIINDEYYTNIIENIKTINGNALKKSAKELFGIEYTNLDYGVGWGY